MTGADASIRDAVRAERLPHFLCPGCGHGIALRALLWAVEEQGIALDRLVVVAGAGCAGRLGAYIAAETIQAPPGQALSLATGLALARPELTVVVLLGDGDGLDAGGNALIHAARRPVRLTCLVLNNGLQGLAGGLPSSATAADSPAARSLPGLAGEPALDPCRLAEAAGAALVARELALHVPALRTVIREALAADGFSLVEVVSTCTEFAGRRDAQGRPSELLLGQSRGFRPDAYHNTVEQPFRPNALPVGVLARRAGPEA